MKTLTPIFASRAKSLAMRRWFSGCRLNSGSSTISKACPFSATYNEGRNPGLKGNVLYWSFLVHRQLCAAYLSEYSRAGHALCDDVIRTPDNVREVFLRFQECSFSDETLCLSRYIQVVA